MAGHLPGHNPGLWKPPPQPLMNYGRVYAQGAGAAALCGGCGQVLSAKTFYALASNMIVHSSMECPCNDPPLGDVVDRLNAAGNPGRFGKASPADELYRTPDELYRTPDGVWDTRPPPYMVTGEEQGDGSVAKLLIGIVVAAGLLLVGQLAGHTLGWW